MMVKAFAKKSKIRLLGLAASASALALLPAMGTVSALAPPASDMAQTNMQVAKVTYVDTTRSVKASSGFAGSDTRRIDVTIWSPPADVPVAAGGRPVVIYSHGSYSHAGSAMYLVQALVDDGYIVVAPDYPLSSRAAYTKITGADPTDMGNQVKDLRFILDQLLADKALPIDGTKIALVGHSLGAVTNYFSTYGSGINEPRIKASVLLGAGDPVQAALAGHMGVNGTWTMPVPVPVLFLSAEHDAFAAFTGRPYTAYSRVSGPKYEIMVTGGVHVWFADAHQLPATTGNPDCVFLGGGKGMAGCELDAQFTTPDHQHDITRVAVLDFLNGYLKQDAAGLDRLRNFPATQSGATIRYES